MHQEFFDVVKIINAAVNNNHPLSLWTNPTISPTTISTSSIVINSAFNTNNNNSLSPIMTSLNSLGYSSK